jgi:hypothetical protein
MKLDDFPLGGADSANESPAEPQARSEIEFWLEKAKRFLEDVRFHGGKASIPSCPPDMTKEKVEEAWPAIRKFIRKILRTVRQKDCPPGVDLENVLTTIREFEKGVRERFRWLKRVVRSPAKAAYDKKRAVERAARDKERTGRSGSRTRRRGAETVAEFEKRLETQRQSRADYDKRRRSRPSGQRINARPVGGQFVIVDSEGVLLREENVPATRTRGKETRLFQRTCLWMVGGAEGYENQVLQDESGLSSARIFDFLLSQPREFASRDPHGRQPIFAAFGASYDQAQILADLPNSKLWEFHTRKKWWRRKKGLHDEERQQSVVLWGGYAVSGKPRKNIVLYKLRNPDRWWRLVKGRKTIDWIERIEIFDVVGFFNSSLLKAIETFPGLVTPAELEILKRGKADRGHVTKENVHGKMPGLKLYTANELKTTAKMMELVRITLETAIPGRPIKLKKWWGAGAVAQALLKDYLGKDCRAKLGDIETPLRSQEEDVRRPLEWGLRAFFGGRGELMKQGLTQDILFLYDIASAYPAQIAQLPSMEGGKWVYRKNPTREEIFQSNMLSMFRVETYNFRFDLPFYPFPFRTMSGAIMFPANVKGVYMRDEVIGGFKYFDEFERQGRLCNRVIHPEGPEIRVTEAMFFIPATDEKRFAFVQELFDLRASIVAVDEDDVRGVILKLAINSIYGKLAQSVGRRGDPPLFASPWMAAAITAGTRRKLIEAALTACDSIVCFATDGIVSTRPLDVFVPPRKTLGHWEQKTSMHGSVFVQSGVYAVMKDRSKGDKGVKIASRGFSPQNIGVSEEVSWTQRRWLKVLFEDIPACWKEGKPAYEFERQQYMTVGASLARNPPPPIKGPGARRPWRPSLIGSWIKCMGRLQLDAMSHKRRVPRDPGMLSSRSDGLIALTVNQWPLGGHTESFPSKPKWMDPLWFGPEWASVREAQEEGVEKDYEGESEIDALDEQDDVIAGLSAG